MIRHWGIPFRALSFGWSLHSTRTVIGEIQCDEELIRRLPLGLAQLYRQAVNAKTALDRHNEAYHLWEAALKLLGSVAVVTYAERTTHDPAIAEPLSNLARPALGHWWQFVRLLAPTLADAGDAGVATPCRYRSPIMIGSTA